MDKPAFDIGRLYAIHWTAERIAYLRHCAEKGMSAAQIAVDIGLSGDKAPRIQEACRRHGVQLRGRPGRPSNTPPKITIELPAECVPALTALGEKHRLAPADVAFALFAAIFDQGETFLDNLLDLDRAGE